MFDFREGEERLVDKRSCYCQAVLAAVLLCAHGVSQLPAAVKPFFVVLTCDSTSDVNQVPVSVCIA